MLFGSRAFGGGARLDVTYEAIVWPGKGDFRCDNVSEARIENDGAIIRRITATAICGSDLHLMDGYQPTMKMGDILGHEPMGEGLKLVEVSKEVTLILPC